MANKYVATDKTVEINGEQYTINRLAKLGRGRPTQFVKYNGRWRKVKDLV